MASDPASSIGKGIRKMAMPTLVNLPFYQCLYSRVKVTHNVSVFPWVGRNKRVTITEDTIIRQTHPAIQARRDVESWLDAGHTEATRW